MRPFLFLLIFVPALQAQTVYESLMSLDKTYAPLFGKEVSSLSMQLIKEYSLGGQDTSLHVMIQVNQSKAEAVGSSIGVSLFSSNFLSGGSARGGVQYVYNKESGVILLGYEDLKSLYDAFNNTFMYISMKQNSNVSNNSLVTYRAKDILFGGEHNPSSLVPTQYYIQVGDAIFNIDASDFLEVGGTLRDMKNRWEKLYPE